MEGDQRRWSGGEDGGHDALQGVALIVRSCRATARSRETAVDARRRALAVGVLGIASRTRTVLAPRHSLRSVVRRSTAQTPNPDTRAFRRMQQNRQGAGSFWRDRLVVVDFRGGPSWRSELALAMPERRATPRFSNRNLHAASERMWHTGCTGSPDRLYEIYMRSI